MNRFYTYKGAIHIHTNLSDGTGDIYAISNAAKKVGLDFIIITDHNHYDIDEGIINGVYVIKAQEISPMQCNHYLALDVNEVIPPNDDANVYVNKVRESGGIGFAAHPDEGFIIDKSGNATPRKNSHHCIPWTDKNIKPDGVEIWNWFSNWADNLDDSNIFKLAYAYLFKNSIVTSPSRLTLNWWDELNKESDKIIPAIGGVDAHALKIKKYIFPVTVFPYETCFNTITNVINLPNKLTENFKEAKGQILNAIRFGANVILNQNIVSDIPKIYIKNKNDIFYCGSDIIIDDGTNLYIEAKKTFEISLLYNGRVIDKAISNNYLYQINDCGKYRVELSYKGKGYLYTNPFNIKKT